MALRRARRVAVGAAVATYTKIEDTLSGSTDKGSRQQQATLAASGQRDTERFR